MDWSYTNATQTALTEAERHFVDVCDGDGELDEEVVEDAYITMMRACAAADEAYYAMMRGASHLSKSC